MNTIDTQLEWSERWGGASRPEKLGWIKGHANTTLYTITRQNMSSPCVLSGAFIPDDAEGLDDLSEEEAKNYAEHFLARWVDLVAKGLKGSKGVHPWAGELEEARLDLEHAQDVALADLQKACVPGMWKCPKCSFVQVNSVIAPGGVYVNAKPELRPCPNDGRDLLPVTWKEHADDLAATCKELLQDRVLLRGLIALGNKEDRRGRWRVTLDWDNYQDGARVLDGDEHVIADCYDLETQDDPEADVEAKFIEAIRRACAAREREEGGGE